jgi:ATP-dependent DNA helicase RecG
MSITLSQLQQWIDSRENEHLEFKEARNDFSFDKLVRYCAALANERGGMIILGVTDRAPRLVVGTQAFLNLEQAKLDLLARLHLRVDAEEFAHADGRVVIFSVPSRPIGTPIQYQGSYYMRTGQSLVPMTAEQLRRIFDEAVADYSAEICAGAAIDDLDPDAVERFRIMWQRRSSNLTLEHISVERLLADAELISDRGVTYAALILMGTGSALGRYLAQAEVIFEYRSSEASLSYQQREQYRKGFFLFHDDIWQIINLRNEVQPFSDQLFVGQRSTFDEMVVREIMLNAVAHRDYQHPGSVFIRQFPRKLEVVSPGGFPPGITPENIIWRQLPRNRRIAEAFEKCGLVERSGQGANRIVERSINDAKALPDYTDTDAHQVSVTINGEIQDPKFLRYLYNVGRERKEAFTTQDWLVLDTLRRGQRTSDDLQPNLLDLEREGLVEKIGRGRGTRYVLAEKYYGASSGRRDTLSQVVSEREQNKAILVEHLSHAGTAGSDLSELREVLPSLTRNQVQKLLSELKTEGRVRSTGRTKAARWFA